MKVSIQGQNLAEGVKDGTKQIDLQRRGKLHFSQGLGFYTLGGTKLGDSTRFGGIYRRRRTGYNRFTGPPPPDSESYIYLSKSYAPTNPRTVPQQAQRQKMTDACIAWNDLTDEEKNAYNKRASRQARIGRILFISEYLKSH